MNLNIFVFGTGKYYLDNKEDEYFSDKNIIAFIDNDIKKIGKLFEKVPIISPNEVLKYEINEIVIMSIFFEEIKSQLIKIGVEPNKIQIFPNGGFKYNTWVRNNRSKEYYEYEQTKKYLKYNPLISIIIPTYNTPEVFFREMIESVVNQNYKNWEICIADASNTVGIKNIIREYEQTDSRIKVVYLKENQGISKNTNAAINMSKGNYVALLDHDDILTHHALYEIVKAINTNNRPDYIYTDEDKIDQERILFSPVIKPNFSPDTLRSCNYITHFSVFSRQILIKVGLLNSEFDGSQDYDLILRVTERANNIVHIPKVLYHWRTHLGSVSLNAQSKLYAFEAAKRALEAHLVRVGLKGTVENGKSVGIYRILYKLEESPLISILLINDNNKKLKERVENILECTEYSKIEIIVLNTSKHNKINLDEITTNIAIKEYAWNEDYNYPKMLNFLIKKSLGSYIIFFGNDIQIANVKWINEMLMYCQLKHIAMVTPKIICEEDGADKWELGGVEEKVLSGMYIDNCKIRNERLLKKNIVNNCENVSSKCYMLKKEVVHKIGAFDERYSTAYAILDLSFKARENGYFIIFNPYAEIECKNLSDQKKNSINIEMDKNTLINNWTNQIPEKIYYSNIHY